MLHETCLFKFFFVKNEKKYGSSSACCCSNLLKLIVRESNLGGVPVFNLPILKSYFFNCSLKPVEGFSLNTSRWNFFYYQHELTRLKKFLLLKLVFYKKLFFPD